MITVQFLKDYVGPDGRRFRMGEVAAFPLNVATELVLAGIAKDRPPVVPVVERKRENL